jgi:hypothetical protein
MKAYHINRIYNGYFSSNISGWDFVSNTSRFTGRGLITNEGNPSPSISIEAAGSNQVYDKGDYGYYYQNFTLDEALSDKLLTLSIDYMYNELKGLNASLYIAVLINEVEVAKTVSLNS